MRGSEEAESSRSPLKILRLQGLVPKTVALVQSAVRLLMLSVVLLCSSGCTTTLREKKATETDPGNATQLKVTGPKVKLAYSF